MLYGILFAVLFLALMGGAIALIVHGDENNKGGMIATGVFGAIVSFVLFLCIPFSFHTVDSGEIAVVKEMGRVIDTREAGVHFDFWMVKKYEKYDTKVRSVTATTMAYSNDKQTMDVEMTIQYQIDKSTVKEIAVTYGSLSALESRINSVVIERTKSVLSQKTASSIISERSTVSAEVAQVVEEAIGTQYHIDVTNVSLTNIDFSDAFEQSVEQSMIAQQEVEKAKAEAEKAKAQAEGELEVAKLQAEAEVARAEAEARAIILKAQADAEALNIQTLEVAKMLGLTQLDKSSGEEIIKENLTLEEAKLIKDYIEYVKYLETWDGKLPEVTTGSNSNGIIIQR